MSPHPAAEAVAQGIAAAHGVSWAEIIGGRGTRQVVAAREAVVLMLRQRGLSMPEISEIIGRRNHTTVLTILRRKKIEGP